MPARKRLPGLCISLLLLLAAVWGWATDVPSPGPNVAPAPATAAAPFDPIRSGTIYGSVRWDGPLPAVRPIEHHLDRPSPNVPVIDPDSRAVANAVVFLRDIEPSRSRRWDHPPVVVHQSKRKIEVSQGGERSNHGFVRRDDGVTFVSGDEALHLLRGQGAAFFTVPFPVPHRPLVRRLSTKGLVELSSAAGDIWLRGYLFVDDHPYYTRTDANGRFCLEQVPWGDHQVVCWVPNWNRRGHDRDPESGRFMRLYLHPPLEHARTFKCSTASTDPIDFLLSTNQFQP